MFDWKKFLKGKKGLQPVMVRLLNDCDDKKKGDIVDALVGFWEPHNCYYVWFTKKGYDDQTGNEIENFKIVETGEPIKNETESILQEAQRLINGDRQGAYGHPFDDYDRTVRTFNALTKNNLTIEEGIIFMVCVKLSRERNKHKRDNLVDAAGYIGCLEMCAEKRKELNG